MREEPWYALAIDGRHAMCVQGYREAMAERKRLAAANPGSAVTMERQR